MIERKNIKQDERYNKQYIKVIKELNMISKIFLQEFYEEIFNNLDDNEKFSIELIELSLYDDIIINLDNFSQWYFPLYKPMYINQMILS